ncbi:MAG: hypothetical protein V1790_19870 [Planctomycetota bacterium]
MSQPDRDSLLGERHSQLGCARLPEHLEGPGNRFQARPLDDSGKPPVKIANRQWDDPHLAFYRLVEGVLQNARQLGGDGDNPSFMPHVPLGFDGTDV